MEIQIDIPTIIAVVALLISIYAAVLSTIHEVREHKQNSPQIAVKHKIREVSTNKYFTIVPINQGPRPVEIHDAFIRLSNGSTLPARTDPSRISPSVVDGLPIKLEQGESANVGAFQVGALQQQLRGLAKSTPPVRATKICVQDAESREYSTKFPQEFLG
jgi:hypothetical protein